MDKWKWLLRIGSFLILLGFFMPAVLVSCNAGFVEPVQSVSLAQMAEYLDTPFLYILPILSIVAIVLSFLQSGGGSQSLAMLWGQLAVLVIQILTLVIQIFSLISKVRSGTFNTVKVTPTIGTFFIIGSAALYLVAWINEKRNFTASPEAPFVYNETLVMEKENQPISPPPPPPFPPNYAPGGRADNLRLQPYLVVLAGGLQQRKIQIDSDNFSVGRATLSQIHLEDPSVSRNHAVFRVSQGVWFIQDQESRGGTFVNGVRTDAIRLNDGDEIGIGPYKFQFRLPPNYS